MAPRSQTLAKQTLESTVKTTLPAWRRLYQRYERLILSLISLAVFFATWELLPRLGLVKPILVSSPSRILSAAAWLFAHGFGRDVAISFYEFMAGYLLAAALGVPLGLLMGWYPRLNAVLDPYVQALNAAPRVALIPIIMIWLGIGLASKVALVFLGAFFPILLNAVAAVQNLDDLLLRCARSFGASSRQIFRTVALPGSVPWLVTGMRVGVGRGLVGVVVAELVAATGGIGHMMSVAGATFQTDKVFVGILFLAGFGYALSEILRRVETRFQSWKPRG